jgi:GNAT superfamily N-acetyltransferase
VILLQDGGGLMKFDAGCLRIFLFPGILLVMMAGILGREDVYAWPGHGMPFELRGMTVDSAKPQELTFFFSPSDAAEVYGSDGNSRMDMVRAFTAALVLPENGIWVNLNPNDQHRIMPEALRGTALGHCLLEQDYRLKQMAARLTDPRLASGKAFWSRVSSGADLARIREDFLSQSLARIWIIPERVRIHEHGGRVFILEKSFGVFMDLGRAGVSAETDARLTEAFRQVVGPLLRDAVNHDPGFLPLRRVFDAVILAAWFREKGYWNASVMPVGQTRGVATEPLYRAEELFGLYSCVLKEGRYRFILEETSSSGDVFPVKYFSGGISGFISPEILIREPVANAVSGQIPHEVDALKVRLQAESALPDNEEGIRVITAGDGRVYHGFILTSGLDRAGFSSGYPTAARRNDTSWFPGDVVRFDADRKLLPHSQDGQRSVLLGSDEVTAFFCDINHRRFTDDIHEGEREDPYAWYAHVRGTANAEKFRKGVIAVIFDPRKKQMAGYAWIRNFSIRYELSELLILPEYRRLGLGTEVVRLARDFLYRQSEGRSLGLIRMDDRSPRDSRPGTALERIWRKVGSSENLVSRLQPGGIILGVDMTLSMVMGQNLFMHGLHSVTFVPVFISLSRTKI